MLPRHLAMLEAEAIHILREGVAEASNPVLLFSGGKDSTVLAHLAARAFFPARLPLPLLHIDSTWEFDETIVFRDRFVSDLNARLIVHANEEGRSQGISPFVHGAALYTEIMRTVPLKAALDAHRFDVVFGGARRDEERSRAKERIFSLRGEGHSWEPRAQRPELWNIFNTRLNRGQTVRVFPLSNWTEADIWTYVKARALRLAPLYFARPRRVVERDGALIAAHDDRIPLHEGETPREELVRFRTVGCWPVTGAVRSQARTLDAVVIETLEAQASERQGRVIDRDDGGSLERKKRDGYF